MNLKVIIIVILSTFTISYSYYYYYIETLMFSEIVGDTDNGLVNIAISIFDFDTGLTRNDIANLRNKKEYWQRKMERVEAINENEKKKQEMDKLTNEMMKDPTMKKISKLLLQDGFDFANKLLNSIN